MTTDTATPEATRPSLTGAGARLAAVTGALCVVVAAVVGLLIAAALAGLGLTTTPATTLGIWLAGAGLLGGWTQTVTADVAGGLEWTTWAAGAPLLVTVAVMWLVSATARRLSCPPAIGTLASAGGAAVAAIGLVLLSGTTQQTTTAAGTVTRNESLSWIWTGGTRPGTILGAVLLVAGTWWVNTWGLEWWRGGRGPARGLLIVPGLVLTVLIGAGLAYLTSSTAVAIAAALLYPLAGVTAMTGLGGAPVAAGVTRLSPEPYRLWIWEKPLYGAIGLVVLLMIAVIVGLVLRWRRHQGTLLQAVAVTALTGAFVTWAADTTVMVPAAQGAQTTLSSNPLAAAVVGAVMAAVALVVRGRPRPPR